MTARGCETIILCEGYHDRAFWAHVVEAVAA
jgi:hypothetical protein